MTTVHNLDDTERLSCRIRRDIKRQIEEAASLLGLSITSFTEATLAEKAASVIANAERIVLSQRDFEAFVEAITHPSPPTPELVKAMEEYERLRKEEPEGNW